MINVLMKLLIAIVIIISTIVVYTLLRERTELRREGLEMKDIKNTSDIILKEPLKNLCIMASSDSLVLNGIASIENIDKLIRKGVRWLDFNVTDNDGVPFASETIRFDKVLNVCKSTIKLSQNPSMPLFINIRISSSGSEPFYNNIHKFIKETFNTNELYNKQGEVKTLLSDTKNAVMDVIKVFTTETNKSIDLLKSKEPFENTNTILGTENELYENLTPLDTAYRSNIREGMKREGMKREGMKREGMKNNDIYEKIQTQQVKIDEINKNILDIKNKLTNTNDKVKQAELENEYENMKKKLTEEEEKQTALEKEINKENNNEIDATLEKMTQTMNAVNSDAQNENQTMELIESQKTAPVLGAIPSVQTLIDELRNDNASLRLQKTTLDGNIGKLESANSSYSDSITSIGRRMNEMSIGAEQELTKKVQCKRCVTGDTLLGELEDKVIFVLTRSQYMNDAYSKSKLSMSTEDGYINTEVRQGEQGEDENFYNVLYSKNNNDPTLPLNLMKITNVPHTTSNTDNMIVNNIKRRNVQVLQVSNLENKPEYIAMFAHFESAFIPMTEVLKYIHDLQ